MAGQVLRWGIRILSVLFGGFWIVIMVVEGGMQANPLMVAEFLLVGLILFGTFGIVLAWFNERIGGRLLAVVAVLHAIYALFEAGRHHWIAVLIGAGPYALLSVGFLIVDRYWPRKRIHPSEAPTIR